MAGSVSPAVTAPQRRRVGAAERMEVLREQILALVADGAADLLILETFGYLDELVEAVSVAASVTSVPLIAQATFADDAHTLGGETPRERPVAGPQGDAVVGATEAPREHQRQARPPIEPTTPCE